jgi:hypothetical protein
MVVVEGVLRVWGAGHCWCCVMPSHGQVQQVLQHILAPQRVTVVDVCGIGRGEAGALCVGWTVTVPSQQLLSTYKAGRAGTRAGPALCRAAHKLSLFQALGGLGCKVGDTQLSPGEGDTGFAVLWHGTVFAVSCKAEAGAQHLQTPGWDRNGYAAVLCSLG